MTHGHIGEEKKVKAAKIERGRGRLSKNQNGVTQAEEDDSLQREDGKCIEIMI